MKSREQLKRFAEVARKSFAKLEPWQREMIESSTRPRGHSLGTACSFCDAQTSCDCEDLNE